MVYRMDLTYDEIVNILDVEYIAGSNIGQTIPTGIYENSDINMMIKSLLPNKVRAFFTINDIRLRSNITTNKTISFIKKSSFYTILGIFSISFGTFRSYQRFRSIDTC